MALVRIMPHLWSDMPANAQAFAKEWSSACSERAQAQTFWNEFFAGFGVQRPRVAVYEKTVSYLKHAGLGRIAMFWPRFPPAEHKSAGADLDAAHAADAKALGLKPKRNGDRERVAVLAALYQRLTSLIPTSPD